MIESKSRRGEDDRGSDLVSVEVSLTPLSYIWTFGPWPLHHKSAHLEALATSFHDLSFNGFNSTNFLIKLFKIKINRLPTTSHLPRSRGLALQSPIQPPASSLQPHSSGAAQFRNGHGYNEDHFRQSPSQTGSARCLYAWICFCGYKQVHAAAHTKSLVRF
jgi:hypothetical protein